MTELLPLPKINTKNEIVDPPTTDELSDDKLSNILTNLVSTQECGMKRALIINQMYRFGKNISIS